MDVEKTCVVCGCIFSVKTSRANSAKTCSKVCRGKYIAARYESQRTSLICPRCLVEFSVPKCHATRRVYCSNACASQTRGKTLRSYAKVSGPDNHNWRSGIGKYREVALQRMLLEAPNHPFIVLEDGKPKLADKLHVHHIDGDRYNNEEGNLLVMTEGSHLRLHKSGTHPEPWECWPPNPEKF